MATDSSSSAPAAAPAAPPAVAPISFAEAPLNADVRAHLAPLGPVFALMPYLPWAATRFMMDAAAGQDPPQPGAPPPAEINLSLLGEDGKPRAARIYEPRHLIGKPSPLVFYVHGGGWCVGSIASHAPVCRALATALGWRVLAVSYRLAPEAQYPAAALDVLAAYRHVVANGDTFGLDAKAPRVVVSGDSAGGQLTLELGLRVRDEPGLLQPALLAPIYPVVNMRGGESDSWVKFGTGGFLLSAASMRDFFKAYLGATPELRAAHATNAHLNADLRADFAGVAPMVLLTAECDILGDEGRALVATVNARGGSVEHIEAFGAVHGCFGAFSAVPSNHAILKKFAAAVKAKVEGAQ
jgi:acetyl esterase